MDVVVIGSGISATLLAQALVARGCFRTLRIIDRTRPLGAHRLAFWADTPTPFDPYVDGSWSTLGLVDARGGRLDLKLERLSYRTFPPARWHADAHARLRETPGVDFVEARVDSIEGRERDAVVHAGGGRYRADWVFSSAAIGRPTPDAWQRFEGWEIELEDDDLEILTPRWMDFRTPAGADFRFVYVLPLGGRRLLVEHVSYRPSPHAALLRAYLDDVARLRGWKVVDVERGATPLFAPAPPRRVGRVTWLGVSGGLAKAATGYALTRMWRDAESIAAALAQHERPPEAAPPGALYRLGDRLLLDLLRRAPERLPGFMEDLGRRASGDAILSFLDERASLEERVQVARAAPGWVGWWLRGNPPHGRAAIARRP